MRTLQDVRVALVTESFLPQVNGVTTSVLRAVEHLRGRGHEVLVVAPRAEAPGPDSWAGAQVLRSPSVPLPGYPGFRLSCPWAGLPAALRRFAPDVVHLASPTVLGAQGAAVARRLGVPAVAVYQTDLAGFARRYGLRAGETAAWRWVAAVHRAATRTLAPSRAAVTDLRRHGVPHVVHWPRGVDAQRFSPAHRDEGLRSRLGRADEVVVGYVGRLAAEKEVSLLAALEALPAVRLVVVGDGPRRRTLERQLPSARFLGQLTGAPLARTFASLDVFVHPGSCETFCQAAQEALASGVPVVGPAAGGLLDLVEPGRTGDLFAPGSAADLRRAVGRLVADPGLRTSCGQGARASVAGRSWEAAGTALLEHYAAAREGDPASASRPPGHGAVAA